MVGIESDNGQLRVVERYDVHNESTPPRTQWSKRSFEVILPQDAVLGGVSAQRPGAESLPTSVTLDPDGPKGHYSFNFPIQPDEGGKGTLFQIQYNLPYSSGKYTFHSLVTLPADTMWVVLPKSMTFSGTGFEPSQQDPTVQTFMMRNVTPGKDVTFLISGTGSFPREDQNAQGDNGQAGAPQGGQPGGGIGDAHQHARSAVEVQMVDSRRAGVTAGGGCGLPAAQAGGGRSGSTGRSSCCGTSRGSRNAGYTGSKKCCVAERAEGRAVRAGE